MSSKSSSTSQDLSQSKLGFEDLHPDIVSEIGRNFPATVQVVAGRKRTESEYELLQSMQRASRVDYYWRPNPLHSLVSVSRKLNSLWTPILMQDVTLSPFQLHGFLSLLWKRPDLAMDVQRLDFHAGPVRVGFSDMGRRSQMVNELTSLDPALLRLYCGRSEDHLTQSERQDQVISAARSLILQSCTKLKELSFISDVTFPLSLSSQGTHSILPTEIRSIEMMNISSDFYPEVGSRILWNFNKVLFMSLFLPNLKNATFYFPLNYKDATFIDLHLPALKTAGFTSRLQNLTLNIHPEPFTSEEMSFEATTIVNMLLSLFSGLCRLQIRFLRNLSRPEDLLFGESTGVQGGVRRLPSFEVFDGLKSSSETLEYISIQGLRDETQSASNEEAQRSAKNRRLSMMNFQVLKYLQVEVGVLDCLLPGCNSKSFALPNSLEILEVIPSLKGIRKKSTDGIIVELLQRSKVPERLRLITAPNVLVDEQREFNASDTEEFQRNKRRLEEVTKNLGISLEFV